MTLWALHWSALVPLAYLVGFRPDAPRGYWLVALGFSVSVFAGLVSLAWPGLNWGITHFYPVVQFSLFAAAASPIGAAVMFAAGVPAVVFALTQGMGSPEIVFTGMGSALVVMIVQRERWAPVLYLYCGLGTLLYLPFATEVDNGLFWWFWWPYQAVRLTSFGALIAYVEREERRRGPVMGDEHGPRDRHGLGHLSHNT